MKSTWEYHLKSNKKSNKKINASIMLKLHAKYKWCTCISSKYAIFWNIGPIQPLFYKTIALIFCKFTKRYLTKMIILQPKKNTTIKLDAIRISNF
jgi:hypothetical protein